MNMAAPISSCPTEIILRVLGFTSRLSNLTAFVQTCHRFWDMANTLLCLTECSSDASKFVKVEEHVAPKETGHRRMQGNHNMSMVRKISRLQSNGKAMHIAAEGYEMKFVARGRCCLWNGIAARVMAFETALSSHGPTTESGSSPSSVGIVTCHHFWVQKKREPEA